MRTRVTVAVVVALAVAGALGSPIQPVYASSDSMAPAIEAGDLYFVDREAAVRTGDVVTFDSEARDGLVTHRVIGEKPGGYVTKGDANPSSDQAAGHPLVDRSAVVGTVVTINERPVTVGGVGPLASWLPGIRASAVWAGLLVVVVLLAPSLLGAEPGSPQRSVVLVDDVVRPLFLGSLLVGLLFVYWGASTHHLDYVATAGTVTAAHTVPVGESVVRTVSLDASSHPFTTVLVRAEGVSVLEQTSTATGLSLLVEVPARNSIGLLQASVHVATYPATLPRWAIVALHEVHWVLAALGTMTPVFAPMYLGYLALIDGRMPIRVPVPRWLRRVGGG